MLLISAESDGNDSSPLNKKPIDINAKIKEMGEYARMIQEKVEMERKRASDGNNAEPFQTTESGKVYHPYNVWND